MHVYLVTLVYTYFWSCDLDPMILTYKNDTDILETFQGTKNGFQKLQYKQDRQT